MNNETATLGIDISKAKFDVCLMQADRTVVARGTFDNTMKGFKQLSRWLTKRKVKKVTACMEATGDYGEPLCQYLYDKSHPVAVVNPQRISHYAKSQLKRAKTDKLDAHVIADFGRTQEFTLWEPRPEEELVLRALVRRYNNFINDRTAELNRRQTNNPELVAHSIQHHIDYLDQQIELILQQVQDHIDQYPALQKQRDLLDSIPGIGPKTAALILAELPPIQRFDNAKQVAAFAGLTPKPQQSGSSLNHSGKLYKLGSSRLRAGLYMPALSAMRHNPPIHALVERLRLKGKHNMTIIIAAMRKLLTQSFAILKSGQPFQADFSVHVPHSSKLVQNTSS